MKIKALDFPHLRNAEHFQFHTEFSDLVGQTNPQVLKIEQQMNAYFPLFEQEDEAFGKVRKSTLTNDITAA